MTPVLRYHVTRVVRYTDKHVEQINHHWWSFKLGEGRHNSKVSRFVTLTRWALGVWNSFTRLNFRISFRSLHQLHNLRMREPPLDVLDSRYGLTAGKAKCLYFYIFSLPWYLFMFTRRHLAALLKWSHMYRHTWKRIFCRSSHDVPFFSSERPSNRKYFQ